MALTCQQRRDYRDRRDLFRPQAGSSTAVLDDEGDPISVALAYVQVKGEQGVKCQLVSNKNQFIEPVGVAGSASVASRRFSESIRDEFGHDVRANDVVRITTRGGDIRWRVVKGLPQEHPNDGSRRMNWQEYDLAPTVPLQRAMGENGIWLGYWSGVM